MSAQTVRITIEVAAETYRELTREAARKMDGQRKRFDLAGATEVAIPEGFASPEKAAAEALDMWRLERQRRAADAAFQRGGYNEWQRELDQERRGSP